MPATRRPRSVARTALAALALLAGVAGAPLADAATYYVSTAGSDANPGTEAKPFRTVTKGVKGLKPGDTLTVKSGTYAEALQNVIPRGTSWEKPVTVAAYPGHTVTLKPKAGTDRVLLFSKAGPQYVEIRGLILDAANIDYNAVHITNGASHVRLRDAEVKNAPQQGILATYNSGYNQFIRVKVHDNGETDFDHGLYLASAHNLVEHSTIYRNAGWGLHVFCDKGYGSTNGNTIRNNKVYENARLGQRGGGILLSSGDGNAAYNNLVWGNKATGIRVAFNNVTQAAVYHNVVYGNTLAGIEVGAASQQAQVRNNISYQNGGKALLDSGAGTVASHNLLNVNPQFVNAAAQDFRLQSGSPAVNKGLTLAAVPKDFAGVTRPQGGSSDIGGYEYTGAATSTKVAAPTTLRVVAPQ